MTRFGFWAVAFAFLVVMAFATLPSPLAEAAGRVIYWYFDEVGNHTDRVGVAEHEKQAAAAALAGAH